MKMLLLLLEEEVGNVKVKIEQVLSNRMVRSVSEILRSTLYNPFIKGIPPKTRMEEPRVPKIRPCRRWL